VTEGADPVKEGDGKGFGVGGASINPPLRFEDGNVKPPKGTVTDGFPSELLALWLLSESSI